jgi:glycosyltransferase involved in cell wall biosynthesis
MITAVIPTISRFQTLQKTVKSLLDNKIDRQIIIIDGKEYKPYYEKIKKTYSKFNDIIVCLNDKRRGWGGSINWAVKEYESDYYLSISDDLIFDKGSVVKAKRIMKHYFPDGDGVVGINQKNMRHFCPAAFVIFGTKWADRFPDRQIYFPGYKHFCVDSELWRYAESIGKFIFAKDVTVTHIRKLDACHKKAQKTLTADRRIWFRKRNRPHLYWPVCKRLEW